MPMLKSSHPQRIGYYDYMILKVCNFKKGNRDRKSKNYTNKLKIKVAIETRWNSIVVTEQKLILKAFAIPILTARL